MKLPTLSAGAPRHALNLCTMVQSISDSEGWGWECSFWEWKRNGYDDYDFSIVDCVWWEGLFERAFEFMLLYAPTHQIGRFIGTDLYNKPTYSGADTGN